MLKEMQGFTGGENKLLQKISTYKDFLPKLFRDDVFKLQGKERSEKTKMNNTAVIF